MAFTSIMFENPNIGTMKQAPVGFSWTVLFFGFFPALFRGDWKWAVIMLILQLVTLGLSSLAFMFLYNKLYINDLICSGYKAKSVANGDMDFVSSKLGIKIPQLVSA